MSRSFSVLIPILAAVSSQAAESRFGDSLYSVLQKANCRACHVDGGIAAATRLHFPEPGASPDQVENFGRSLTALVNRDQPESSLLFTKPTNREKHTGGKLIAPGTKEEAVLLDSVPRVARPTPHAPHTRAPEKPPP